MAGSSPSSCHLLRFSAEFLGFYFYMCGMKIIRLITKKIAQNMYIFL